MSQPIEKVRTGTISFQNTSTVVSLRVFQKPILSSVTKTNGVSIGEKELSRILDTLDSLCFSIHIHYSECYVFGLIFDPKVG